MPSSTITRFAAKAFAVAAATALGLSLSGCSVLSDVLGRAPEAVRDAETQEIIDAGQADVFSIKVGDCLNEADGETVSAVPVVPCGEPHDEEAYFEYTFSGDVFPGADAVSEQADEACYGAFAGFVGLAYEESALDYFPYIPTEESWNGLNDRVVTCMVYDPAAQSTGTLSGAAR